MENDSHIFPKVYYKKYMKTNNLIQFGPQYPHLNPKYNMVCSKEYSKDTRQLTSKDIFCQSCDQKTATFEDVLLQRLYSSNSVLPSIFSVPTGTVFVISDQLKADILKGVVSILFKLSCFEGNQNMINSVYKRKMLDFLFQDKHNNSIDLFYTMHFNIQTNKGDGIASEIRQLKRKRCKGLNVYLFTMAPFEFAIKLDQRIMNHPSIFIGNMKEEVFIEDRVRQVYHHYKDNIL